MKPSADDSRRHGESLLTTKVTQIIPIGVLSLIFVLLLADVRVRFSIFSITLSELGFSSLLTYMLITNKGKRFWNAKFLWGWTGIFAAVPLIFVVASFGWHADGEYFHSLSNWRNACVPLALSPILMYGVSNLKASRIEISLVMAGTFHALYALIKMRYEGLPPALSEEVQAFINYKSTVTENALGFPYATGLNDFPHSLSCNLIPPALLSFYGFIHRNTGEVRYLAAFAIIALAIIFTFQRSAFVTVGVGAAIFSIVESRSGISANKLKAFFVYAAALVGAVIFMKKIVDVFSIGGVGTLEGRMELNQAAIDLWLNRPSYFLLGSGTEAYLATGPTQMPHNQFLYLILQFGISAVFMAATMVCAIFITKPPFARRAGLHVDRGDTSNAKLHARKWTIIAACIFFIYASQTSFFDSASTTCMFALVLAMVMASRIASGSSCKFL